MSYTDNIFAEDQEDEFGFLYYVFKYLRYWYWFVLMILLSCLGAYVYLKRYTPIYQVHATLLIKDEKAVKKGEDVIEEFSVGSSKQLVNEVALLKSRALMGRVVDALGLTISYWVEARSRDVEIYTNTPIKLNPINLTEHAHGKPLYVKDKGSSRYELFDDEHISLGTFSYSQLVESKYGKFRIFPKDSTVKSDNRLIQVRFTNRESVISAQLAGLGIEPVSTNSSFLRLDLETPLPQKGKDILAKLLDEYAFMSLDDKNREATNTLRFIEERLKLVTEELGTVERDVERYREVKGITDLSSESNLFLQKIGENDAKINELDIQLKVLEGVEQYISSSQISVVAPSTLMVNDPILNSYIAQLSELEIERSKLAQTVQPGNAYLETVNSQMKNIKQAIRENLNNQKASLRVTKNSILANNNRLQGSIASVPRKEREFVGIKRQAGIKEDLYLLLLKKREETAISYASTVTDSRIVDVPYGGGGIIRPNKQNTYVIAIIIGLLIPFSVISVKEALTTAIQSKREIEQKTGMKVFGEIGVKPKQDKGEIIDVKSKSFVSEQIRIIRSNLQYLFMDSKEGAARTILITSSTGGEGKSFVTLNIAASLALLDKRVLILGLDMRKPKINQYIGVSNRFGLSNYLIGMAKPEDVIQVTSLENVYMAPSGPIPPNPSELLSNGRMKDFLETVNRAFDYIIIDTPPLSLVTDAMLLAPYTDVCFYLVRHQKTPKLYLKNVAELNQRKAFRSFHILFNAVNYENSSEHGYGYGYGYGYGKEGYYGEESPKKGIFSRLIGKG